MADKITTLGLIAGNRSLPLLVASQARATGIQRIVAAAFENETDPKLSALVDEIKWLRVGQLSALIEAFQSWGVRHCVMAGQSAPKNLFDLRPDLRSMKLLFRIKEKNAQSLFGAIADELKKEGIELISAIPWLGPMMPSAGFSLGSKLSESQASDIQFGAHIAKEVSRLEIGQTVVVKAGTVLAVEGFEGTDACLRRGGELAGKSGEAVAVKAARQGHDLRFDIPCVGPTTVEICMASGIQVLAVEAGRTLVLEREQIQTLTARKRFTLATFQTPSP